MIKELEQEVKEWELWVREHPADFAARLVLTKLMLKYGDELDKQQEQAFRDAGA